MGGWVRICSNNLKMGMMGLSSRNVLRTLQEHLTQILPQHVPVRLPVPHLREKKSILKRSCNVGLSPGDGFNIGCPCQTMDLIQ
jgi:hypothetical protein